MPSLPRREQERKGRSDKGTKGQSGDRRRAPFVPLSLCPSVPFYVIEFSIVVDAAQLRAVEDRLRGIAGAAPKAIATAINKTLPQARTLAARGVREVLNLPYGAILERMSLQKASADRLSGAVTVKRKPVKLIEYRGARQTRQGVSVRVRRGGAAEVIPHAFIATMKSGHEGIFKREGAPRMAPGKRKAQVQVRPALPIKELYGPTVVGVLAGNQPLNEQIQTQISAKFARNLESQTQWLLNQ